MKTNYAGRRKRNAQMDCCGLFGVLGKKVIIRITDAEPDARSASFLPEFENLT